MKWTTIVGLSNDKNICRMKRKEINQRTAILFAREKLRFFNCYKEGDIIEGHCLFFVLLLLAFFSALTLTHNWGAHYWIFILKTLNSCFDKPNKAKITSRKRESTKASCIFFYIYCFVPRVYCKSKQWSFTHSTNK